MSENAPHGGCSTCGRTDVSLKNDGTLRMHVHANRKGSSFLGAASPRCPGAGKLPKAAAEQSGEAL